MSRKDPSATAVLVLGGSGRTGIRVLNQAVERGHRVRALVRQPAAVDAPTGVELIPGTPADIDDLRRAAAGADAVVSALNNSRASDNPWSKALRTAPVSACSWWSLLLHRSGGATTATAIRLEREGGNTMAWIAASVFGLSWGVLLAWIDTRTSTWLPRACSAVLFAVVAVFFVQLGPAGAPGIALALGALLGFVVSTGVLWRDHPALAGLTYSERVRIMLFKGSAIRAHRSELPAHQAPGYVD